MSARSRTVADITTSHYQDLNGGIYCVMHLGVSAHGVVQNDPAVKAFDTELTRWVRLSARDKFDFAKFIGSAVICESCRGGY